ncbi:heterokaryon incompatibility protein-domain-containing protein [Hypoxylon argillaceum]|nr:heterokaryon incompatibility protein-domain-containing protein [Hypoxylon argillaceum]
MPLCQDCCRLDLRALVVKACHGEDVSRNPLLGYEPPGIPYKSSVASIQESIESTQCQLCTLIWNRWADPSHYDTKHHLDKPFYFTVSLAESKITYFSVYQIRSLNDDDPSSLDHNQIIGQCGLVHRFGDELDDSELSTQFLSDQFGPDTTLDSILFRDLDANTGSKHTLRIANDWLAQCKTRHSLCSAVSRSRPANLPSRVIDVTAPRPRVIETGGVEGRWAALSYCWGSDTSFMLNEGTRAQLFAGFQLDAAPATIRDAILVTRELGIPHLWVDALCIRQDSREDWEREAPRMMHVYAQAELVIAASDAADVNAGLFRERAAEATIPLPWTTTKGESQKGREQRIYARLAAPDISTGGTGESRWGGRGWTMQEAFLAGRLLTFSRGGLTWQCQQLTEQEDGPYVINIPDVDKDEWMHRTSALFMCKYWRYLMTASAIRSSNADKAGVPNPPIPDGMYTDPYSMWYVTLAHYSSRYLSHVSDRLHALSGLADLFREVTGDEYVAGLWKGDLLRGLAWTYRPSRIQEGVDIFAEGVDPVYDELTVTNAGPSWSWTSLEGRIYEPEDGYRGHFERVPGNRAKVLHVEVDVNVADRLQGSLKIQAPSVTWPMGDAGRSEERQANEIDPFVAVVRDYVVGIMKDGSESEWEWDFSTRFSAEYKVRRAQAQGAEGRWIAVVFLHPDGTALVLESTSAISSHPRSPEGQSLSFYTYRRLGVLQIGVDIIPPLTPDEQEPRKRRRHDVRAARLAAYEGWYQGLPLHTFIII